jgi:transcriptional regulator with XRE-family HTH domain
MSDPTPQALVDLVHEMCLDGSARTLRLNANLQLKDITAKTGIEPAALSRYERGLQLPRFQTAQVYGAVLYLLSRNP